MGRNLLLGYGELLSENIDWTRGSSEKRDPYGYAENKKFLVNRLKDINKILETFPKLALADEKFVLKLTLHPTYLAKSFYPESLLNAFNLTDLGSRSVTIKPRKPATSKAPV